MALIRWEPAREVASLQGEVNRLFNSFFDAPGGDGVLRRWVPAMDLIETGEHFILKADLPGVAEGDVSIEVEDRVLTVSGERRAEHEERQEGYVRVERAFGSFRRSVTLPTGVDPEGIAATFNQGVLEVRIPKPAQRRPHAVKITAGTPDVEGSAEPAGDGDAPAAQGAA
jgi:HSP20 family protein